MPLLKNRRICVLVYYIRFSTVFPIFIHNTEYITIFAQNLYQNQYNIYELHTVLIYLNKSNVSFVVRYQNMISCQVNNEQITGYFVI